jgi:hypothetical protein
MFCCMFLFLFYDCLKHLQLAAWHVVMISIGELVTTEYKVRQLATLHRTRYLSVFESIELDARSFDKIIFSHHV